MSVITKIADFMEALLANGRAHHGETKQQRGEIQDMAATLQSINDKLTAQGQQIAQLTAAAEAKEQADLDAIDAKVDANTALMTSALAPKTDPAAI